MIAVGNDIDRDADARGYNHLRAGAVNGFDKPPAEFLGIFKIEHNQVGRCMGLIEWENGFNGNRSRLTKTPVG